MIRWSVINCIPKPRIIHVILCRTRGHRNRCLCDDIQSYYERVVENGVWIYMGNLSTTCTLYSFAIIIWRRERDILDLRITGILFYIWLLVMGYSSLWAEKEMPAYFVSWWHLRQLHHDPSIYEANITEDSLVKSTWTVSHHCCRVIYGCWVAHNSAKRANICLNLISLIS